MAHSADPLRDPAEDAFKHARIYDVLMRVIAGTYRSRLLVSPPGTTTRPTSDRLRETLFNILAPRLDGCRFLDLYAGTGAVGIEALSRRAAFVWFAENAPPALKALRANLTALKIGGGYALEDRSTAALLTRLVSRPPAERIDLVYLDPPYEAEDEYTQTLGLLGGRQGAALLTADAWVIAEHASRSRFPMPERAGGLTRIRVVKQGDASLSIYARPSSQAPSTEAPPLPPTED